ncbi:MAG: TIGR04013 family B12-binding domain/radical SAM domain-containing protein [Planctomycetes bacterium]|nr:TIGR04013 family B12-binding domain/radical SAM domain-containing protein [Planctomycetota bacterium]
MKGESGIGSDANLILRASEYGRTAMITLLGSMPEDVAARIRVRVARKEGEVDAILAEVASRDRDSFLAISLPTSEILHLEGRIARWKTHPRVVVIAGGAHATGDPASVFSCGADHAVLGEGEVVFWRLLRALLEGEGLPRIRGLAWREGETIRTTGTADPVDIDAHLPANGMFGLFAKTEVSRGCAFGCAYCQTPRLSRGGMRHRSLDAIRRAMEGLAARRIRIFRFLTPNALSYGSPGGAGIDIGALDALLGAIRRAVGSRPVYYGGFPSECRPEFVNDETVALLRRHVDTPEIIIGAQSGSDRVLRETRRGHTVEDARRAIRLLRAAGFGVIVDLLFGIPGETEDDARATLELAREAGSLGARIHGHTFLPLPGTPFWRREGAPIAPALAGEIARLEGTHLGFGTWRRQEEIRYALERWLAARELPAVEEVPV